MRLGCADPQDIFENGTAIAVIADRDSNEIEYLVVSLSEQIGIKMDWSYMAGWGTVRAIDDLPKCRDAFRPYTNGWLKVIEENGKWTG